MAETVASYVFSINQLMSHRLAMAKYRGWRRLLNIIVAA